MKQTCSIQPCWSHTDIRPSPAFSHSRWQILHPVRGKNKPTVQLSGNSKDSARYPQETAALTWTRNYIKNGIFLVTLRSLSQTGISVNVVISQRRYLVWRKGKKELMWSKRENLGEQRESQNKFSRGNVRQKDVDTWKQVKVWRYFRELQSVKHWSIFGPIRRTRILSIKCSHSSVTS